MANSHPSSSHFRGDPNLDSDESSESLGDSMSPELYPTRPLGDFMSSEPPIPDPSGPGQPGDQAAIPNPSGYVCPKCPKSFKHQRNFVRHWRDVHAGAEDRAPHQKRVKKDLAQKFVCPYCEKAMAYERNLRAHIKQQHQQPSTSSSLGQGGKKRKINDDDEDGRAEFVQPPPKKPKRASYCWKPSTAQEEGLPPIDQVEMPSVDVLRDQGYNDNRVIDLMKKDRSIWSFMRTNCRTSAGRYMHTFNMRLHPPQPGVHVQEIKDFIRALHRRSDEQYRLNIAFGFLMQTRTESADEVPEIRYFYPSEGNYMLFPTAPLVQDGRDLETRVLDNITEDDTSEFLKQARPSTKWMVTHVCNVRVWHYKIRDKTVLGAAAATQDPPPDFIANSRYIKALYLIPSTGRPYQDYKCVFRAVAEYERHHMLIPKQQRNGLEARTSDLIDKFVKKYAITDFRGVRLNAMHKVELMLKKRIWIFHLTKDPQDGSVKATPVYKSQSSFPSKWPQIDLCVWGKGKYQFLKHAGLITNLTRMIKTYACEKCSTVFDKHYNLLKHQRSVECIKQGDKLGTITTSPGGGYMIPHTIFELLYRAGVYDIRAEDKIKRAYSFFDFESYLKKMDIKITDNLKYVNSLHPLCVSVSTEGVQGYCERDGVFFIDRHNPENLVHQMVDHMLEVAKACYEQTRPRYQYIFDQLTELSERLGIDPKLRDHYSSLEHQLDNWIRSYTIWGFNSGHFDINLCREWLLPYLTKVDCPKSGLQMIKKGNSYMKLKSQSLQFLDIRNFISPGSNYANWLKAYGVKVGKFVFPYTFLRAERLDELLDQTFLPSIEEFKNNLKDEQLDPATYEMIKDTWRQQGWKCVEDYLVFYCTRDTAPAREAVNKMIDYWATNINGYPICIMDSVSLPGLSSKNFHPVLTSDTFIMMPNKRSQEFYSKIRDQIVGGPSIIWTRYHESGKTMIRANKPKYNKEMCKSCVGFDANALYLYCLGGDDIWHSTGVPVEWRYNSNSKRFHPRYMLPNHVSHAELEWLLWMAKEHEADGQLEHYYNKGQLRIPGRAFSYDGVIYGPNRKCFNFYGCYFHPHDGCPLVKQGQKERDPDYIKNKESYRQESEEWARSNGFPVHTIRECEWIKQKRSKPNIMEYLSRHLLTKLPTKMTDTYILDGVKNGRFYGYVEVDIEVESDSPIWEKCEECSPIYRHAALTSASAGPFMQKYADEKKIKPSCNRMLIGAMNARKMLFSSAYLKFLLDLGLKVTRVYSAYQFKPKQLFKDLATTVTEKRREADRNPDMKIIGEGKKLEGNAFYGKTLENSSHRHRIRIISDENKLSKFIKNSSLTHVEEITSPGHEKPVYEVVTKPKKIVDRACVIIGYTVLQYAKVRMLEWYYHFMDKFFDRKDWEMIVTDTDSKYMGVSRGSWDEFERDCVKPGMEIEYANTRHWFLPRNDTEENRRYDARTLGIFKQEWSGSKIIALNSKTYFGASISQGEVERRTNEIMDNILLSMEEKRIEIEKLISEQKAGQKCVSKGVPKKVKLNDRDYENVLRTKESRIVEQTGLKYAVIPADKNPDRSADDNSIGKRQQMVDYCQKKIGLSFAYFKRVVDENWINTYPPPLDV